VVERRPGVMPPKPGPPPRQVPRRRILVRRASALALVVVLVAVGAWFAYAATRSTSTTSPEPITSVRVPTFEILFPEGWTREQMADKVARDARIANTTALSRTAYLALTRRVRVPGFGRKPRPAEGFLFPATYDFTRQTTSRQLVTNQLQAFRRNWSHIDLRYARSKNLTPYDVLIIASMVEKEALAPDERPKIARVIYNRLHARMPLGIDSTLRYGLDIPPTKSIRVSQLESNNPYNTRKLLGLPPTPIANPGLASMQAAAHPAKGDWLYFARKPDRVHHFFTASASEFNHYLDTHGFGRH
jgi:uncharacterized YceG family protein